MKQKLASIWLSPKFKKVIGVVCIAPVLIIVIARTWFPEPPKLRLLDTIEAQSNIIALRFTSDASTLISASGYTPVKLWNWRTKKLLTSFSNGSSNTLSLAVSPSGNLIATGHGNFRDDKSPQETQIKIWDKKTGKLLKTLKGHTEQVRSVAFSPDGSRLVSGSQDKTVNLWDVNSGNLIQSISAHTDHVTSVAFSHDGKTIASASDDKTIKIWSANNLRLLQTLDLLHELGGICQFIVQQASNQV